MSYDHLNQWVIYGKKTVVAKFGLLGGDVYNEGSCTRSVHTHGVPSSKWAWGDYPCILWYNII